MPPQQPGSRPSWSSGDDYAGFNLIVILVGVVVFGYLLWDYYHAQISAFVMLMMHYEIRFIDNFTDHYAVADQEMRESDPSWVTFKELYGITQAVGMFFRVPATGVVVVLAIVCTVRASTSRYKRNFDLDGLIREQSQGFPVISAFSQRRLKLQAPNLEKLRPADYALSPKEWIAGFALDQFGGFHEGMARSALAGQLGMRWRSPEETGPAQRLLFVAFALHLAERRDEALQLLGSASASIADAKQDGDNGPDAPLTLPAELVAEVDMFLQRKLEIAHKDNAAAIAGCHAYVTTALMALLNESRIKSGVMAPAQFVWLKLVDRNLWYALHSLGYEIEGIGRYIHPNPRVEALGARDHWAAERVAGRPILKPSLDESLATLRRFTAAAATEIDA